jgi:hypothetical protein
MNTESDSPALLVPTCPWCNRPFTPRRDGGKAQRFCRPACRRAYDAAGRRWVAEAIAGGMLTLGALRNGAAATRALAGGGKIPSETPPPPPQPPDLVLGGLLAAVDAPAPVASAARLDEAAELLGALLAAVQSEGWHSLAAAMPQELFDRLKRWRAGRLAKDRA